jgi:hypothetical protein
MVLLGFAATIAWDSKNDDEDLLLAWRRSLFFLP